MDYQPYTPPYITKLSTDSKVGGEDCHMEDTETAGTEFEHEDILRTTQSEDEMDTNNTEVKDYKTDFEFEIEI